MTRALIEASDALRRLAGRVEDAGRLRLGALLRVLSRWCYALASEYVEYRVRAAHLASVADYLAATWPAYRAPGGDA